MLVGFDHKNNSHKPRVVNGNSRMYILNSRGPKADHKVHEVWQTVKPWYETVCGKLAIGPVYREDPPALIAYCRECFEAVINRDQQQTKAQKR